jgi:hypothetical protein
MTTCYTQFKNTLSHLPRIDRMSLFGSNAYDGENENNARRFQ